MSNKHNTCQLQVSKTKRIKKNKLQIKGILLVGPPTLTTSNGFGKGANSSCQIVAAIRRAAESA